MKKKWQKIQQVSEYLVDGVALFCATLATYLFFGKVLHRILVYTPEEWKEYCFMLFVAYTAITLCFSSSIDLAKRARTMEFLAVLRNCSLIYMQLAVLLLLFKNPIIDSRYLFIGSFLLLVPLSCLGRYILKRALTNNFSNSKSATLVGVLVSADRAEPFLRQLQADWTKRVDGVALLPAAHAHNTPTGSEYCGVTMLPDLESFLGWVRLSSVDEVFINFSATGIDLTMEQLNAVVEELEDMGVLVHINIPTLEQFVEESKFNHMRCDIVGGYPMVGVSATVQDPKKLVLKRIGDIAGALVGLIISVPIILLVALPLVLESPGGLFFKQQRVGRNGRLFYMYKLRSMYADADRRKKEFEEKNNMQGLMFKMDNDPRITKVGRFIRKFSIDELPQFYNVLRGDMSLVGTRPPTLDEFEQYSSHHKRRLSMRPGITGLWQVSGRSQIVDFEEVVHLDCQYIDNWSPLLDTKILFKTVGVVLTGRGAQ